MGEMSLLFDAKVATHNIALIECILFKLLKRYHENYENSKCEVVKMNSRNANSKTLEV